MGNNLSVPEEAEDDNTCTVKSYQPLPESPEGITNGSAVFAQSPPPAGNGEADARAAAAQDNAAVSPAEPAAPGPGDARAGGQSGGSAASRALPAARPRSLLPFPWAVPAPAQQPAAAPAPAEPTLGASKGPGEGTEGPGAAPQQGSHKNPGQAALQDVGLAGTPEGRDVAAPKGRAVTLLDRIFRLEKGTARTAGDPEQGRQGLDVPNGSIAAHGEPLREEIDECRQKELGQDSAGEQDLAAPGRAQAEQHSRQAAAGQGSVMSFLKTLVSPGKADAKSDSEDKAAKETQQTANTKSPEQPPVSCVKADRNVPACPEPLPKQNPKAPEPAAPPQSVSTEPPREGTKDKGSATPLPLSKLFWKKNSSEEAEAVSNEKAEVALEAVAPDRDESKGTESTEVKPRGAESKTPKANLRKFFKLTLNATEKPLAPSQSDPGGPRSKEGSKDKKATLELGRQKGREQPEPREQPAAEPDAIHNGGDAKEPPCKKAEKRQSLGGFFKGLGSKRMSDAEVQTDPVSILPAGKSK
ncbi:breast carcinoma-amplified sequence 1 isoform X3 [Zonotrichia albicollis]|uniref:breast carcinoma-amplified sequence 1 isoform X3 n=1 Tax=Zonotrichia albicollis TaxID=44394 RepID=UPI003D81243F